MADATHDKIRRYRCPGCSADLVFDPKDGCLSCPYCGRLEVIPASGDQVRENSYEEYLRITPAQLGELAEDALEINCATCGAIVTFRPPLVTGVCSFCAAPMVAQPKSADPLIAPEGLLPFKITRQQATQSIKSWLASRWFAPNALKAMARQESINGVYLPFWTYDSHTISHYTGERGEHYWETETYTERDSQGNLVTRTRQVQRTRWYPASGAVSRWFDDVLIPATRSLSRERLMSLEPWGLDALLAYEPAFLAGFQAQRYQVDLAQGFEAARGVMAGVIDGDVRRDIGGDEQRVNEIATSYSGITFKHVLLPVWISAYRFSRKIYQVMVNARTAEVQGERPYSAWKIACFVLSLLVAVMLIMFLSEK